MKENVVAESFLSRIVGGVMTTACRLFKECLAAVNSVALCDHETVLIAADMRDHQAYCPVCGVLYDFISLLKVRPRIVVYKESTKECYSG